MKKDSHIVLVDGSGYIFRAYHALPPLTRKSDGLPCGAVAGFCNMLWKLISDAKNEQYKYLDVPTHFAVIFDYSSKTFRKELYPEYKANRPAPPEDLIPQFALIRAATRAFNVPCIELEGYEADDIIATYARKAEAEGQKVTIISSDKDLMQLVSSNIHLYDTMKNKATGVAEVEEKWGVAPQKMIDFQALVGDSADNVPGVSGIGPKTAADLLKTYGTLEQVLANTDQIKQKKRRETLIEQADRARLSRQLVELCTHVPVEPDLDGLVLMPPNGPRLIGFLKAMEFNTLIRRVAKAYDVNASYIEPDNLDVDWDNDTASLHGPDMEINVASNGEKTDKTVAKSQKAEGDRNEGKKSKRISANAKAADPLSPYDKEASPQGLAINRQRTASEEKIDRSQYQTITEAEELKTWLNEAKLQGYFAFDTETNSLNTRKAELVGFSIALKPGKAAYIPLAHRTGEADLLGEAPLQKQQIAKDEALALLKPILAATSVLKIGQNIKYDMNVMAEHGLLVQGIDDTMLLSYVLNAGTVSSHGLDALAKRWLQHQTIAYSDVAKRGTKMISFAEVDIATATEYAAEDADVTLRLWFVLKQQLIAHGLASDKAARQSQNGLVALYEREERALVPVLALMEQRGVLVDKQILAKLSQKFSQEADNMAQEIYQLAGEEFNIGSPKQLGEILFGKFELPGGRKTKTGQWSTSAQALDDLAANQSLVEAGGTLAQGQKVASKIVGWRQLKKLQSTYTDALPNYCDANNRVHTNYSLAATSTGRLASSEPNLQNIPVRTAEGRSIRQAFIAPKGKMLISADYSQIELRILAHVADIKTLRQAFADNIDIHAKTASEMFSVPLEDMTAEIRRRAKAINFGIIYGISAFGLSNQLGISREEASQYIKTYFERFPGIKEYMEKTKEFARQHGYVETIFGRRIHYPDIKASNGQVRSFNERAAINAPIQGAAADIIRRAMVQMETRLKDKGINVGEDVKMLLQVHDELIFEVVEDKVEEVLPLIREIMEDAAFPAANLSVPLKVEASAAKNWDEAH